MTNKSFFENCELLVFRFSNADVIATSGGNGAFEGDGDFFGGDANSMSAFGGNDC